MGTFVATALVQGQALQVLIASPFYILMIPLFIVRRKIGAGGVRRRRCAPSITCIITTALALLRQILIPIYR